MTENNIIDLTKLADVHNYVMNALPELYVKYLEKRSTQIIMYKKMEGDPTLEYFDCYLTVLEQTYNELTKILGISQTLSERISELNL